MTEEEKRSALEIKRHSLSHIMAAAVAKLWPEAKFAIGPAVDNGFYYDIDFGDVKVGSDDFAKIEDGMRAIIKADLPFVRSESAIDEALAAEKQAGNEYKADILAKLKEEGETKVSYYDLGDYRDLCRGPHVVRSGQIDPESFRVAKIAGAYWQGDDTRPMLTRLYGYAFESKAELDAYQSVLVEAERRDHRKLGKELDLFHIDETVGLGLPLWHPKGARLWRVIEDFWYQEHLKNGYELVRTPHIGNRKLWEMSGHWGFYSDSMYPPLEVGQTLKDSQENAKAKEPEQFLLKPMNCPFHAQIYKNRPRSYRELPMRWAECGTVYRFEKKGELSGLTRVRGFTQDDAHIICRPDQVEAELKRVVDFILFIYKSFGFDIGMVNVYLSVRDPESKKYAGTDEGWDLTERVLEKIAGEKGLNISKDIGGAVFYGPKLDFKVKDAIGREWQCSTLQFDFNLPERFDLSFVNGKGEKERPYMLHRALFGSFERFIGVLIEHYAGAFPFWLSPVQIKFLPVADRHLDPVAEMARGFAELGFRVEIDETAETVGNKIRRAIGEKIPYLLVVGDKELGSDGLAIRRRGEDAAIGMSREAFIAEMEEKNKTRS